MPPKINVYLLTIMSITVIFSNLNCKTNNESRYHFIYNCEPIIISVENTEILKVN